MFLAKVGASINS